MDKFEREINEIKNGKIDKTFCFKLDKNLIELTPVNISQQNIKLITKWRKKNQDAFLTKFNVTENNTKSWLEDIYNNTGRILFLIYKNKKKIGHIGIYKYNKKYQKVDVDSVLKGVKISEKNLMEKVLCIIFKWVFQKMELKSIQLEVFSDNFKAINLYERAGMFTVNSTPIKKIKTKEGWIWKENKKTQKNIEGKYLSLMEITKKDYFEKIHKN